MSGTSNTVSNKSTGSNSNQSESAKNMRRQTRERFRAEGQPESWWNPRWYYLDQVRRRKKRAENAIRYTSERPVPRPKISARQLVERELTGKLAVKYKVGNMAIRILRSNGRREYMSLKDFNSKYGQRWKNMGAVSRRLIAPEINSNLRRKNIKVIKFVNSNT